MSPIYLHEPSLEAYKHIRVLCKLKGTDRGLRLAIGLDLNKKTRISAGLDTSLLDSLRKNLMRPNSNIKIMLRDSLNAFIFQQILHINLSI